MKVRKAVIPVAGFGTRLLPASRSVPKVMLPVLSTPAVHYAVKEAVEAGMTDIVFIVSKGQQAIQSYFDGKPDLEAALERRGDTALLAHMLAIPEMAEISYVQQDEQLGLGHAVLLAQPLVGEEPFAVLLPDDLILADTPTILDMIDMFTREGSSVIAAREVPNQAVPSVGIIEPNHVDGRIYEIKNLVEKPMIADAPSNLAIIGRYVLAPQVFEELKRTPPGAVGEIQITDAISSLLSTQKAFAYRFPGVHFDVGTPLGLLKASIYAALQREEMAEELRSWLSSMV